VVTSVAHG